MNSHARRLHLGLPSGAHKTCELSLQSVAEAERASHICDQWEDQLLEDWFLSKQSGFVTGIQLLKGGLAYFKYTQTISILHC